MDKEDITLSILLISHNQAELIPRCISSILNQKLNFTFEIIVSDDASTDKTWEIIQEYVKKYPDIISAYQINSSDINPVNRSERCGYNKANAYNNSKGKYFVNIDADDFLLSFDIYQMQVEMLEKHPECVMCMQNVSYYNEGLPPIFLGLWFPEDKIETGKILTATEYILGNYSILNQAFVTRRLEGINPGQILQKDFDDTMITLYHLQYGNVICISRADYAYVISENSINSSLVGVNREVMMFGHIFYLIHFIPRFAGLVLKANLVAIRDMMGKTIRSSHLSVETKKWLEQFQGFSFRIFLKENLTLSGKLRKKAIWLFIRIIRRYNLHFKPVYMLLYMLLIGHKSMDENLNLSAE